MSAGPASGNPSAWQAKEKIKQVRDELLALLGADAKILCSVDDSGGIISLNGKQIGLTNNTEGIMELNLSDLIENMPLPKSYADLSFEKATASEYKKFSLQPFIVRDVAVFVSDLIPAEKVWETIKKGIQFSNVDGSNALELLVQHSLFDTFKKFRKISYAFRMVFQSMDRTLTDAEANSIIEKIHSALKGEGWEVR